MFRSMSDPKAAYTTVERDISVEAASPHKLILMLFDGALLSLTLALAHLEKDDRNAMSREISRATDIISLGLRDSVNTELGDELSDRLVALYDYMAMRLQVANSQCKKAIIEEVVGLLRELHNAWLEIADDPAVVSRGMKSG